MTGVQAFGVLLFFLGVLYALVYVGWLPRPRRNASGAGMTGAATEPPGTQTGPAHQPRQPTAEPTLAPGLPRPLTLAWVDGTYLSTTVAISRHERVAAAGLGERARAAMVVDDSTVRWEREGTGEVRVPRIQLREASLGRQLAKRLPVQAHPVLVSWTADNGERYVTGFLPRSRADSAVLVSAVQRLMKIGAPIDDAPRTPDGTP